MMIWGCPCSCVCVCVVQDEAGPGTSERPAAEPALVSPVEAAGETQDSHHLSRYCFLMAGHCQSAECRSN